MRTLPLPKVHWLLMILVVVIIIARSFIATPEVQAITPCRTYDPVKEDPAYCADDERVNPYDEIQTMTAYCLPDHSLNVFAVIGSRGVFLYNVSGETLANSLATAKSTQKHVFIKEDKQRQVWALSTGEIQLHDYSGVGYDYKFRGDLCGAVPVTKAIPESKSNSKNVASATKPPSLPAQAQAQAKVAPVAVDTIATGRLTIRNDASPQGDILGYVLPNTSLHIVGRDITWNWVKVTHHGVTGWVSAQHSGVTNDDMRQLPVLRD